MSLARLLADPRIEFNASAKRRAHQWGQLTSRKLTCVSMKQKCFQQWNSLLSITFQLRSCLTALVATEFWTQNPVGQLQPLGSNLTGRYFYPNLFRLLGLPNGVWEPSQISFLGDANLCLEWTKFHQMFNALTSCPAPVPSWFPNKE